MLINFVDVDRRSIDVLADTAVFQDIVSPAHSEDFHSRLDQLAGCMGDGHLRQKITLYRDSFDDGILRMGQTAMRIFGLAREPHISRVLYSAISLAEAESSPDVFQDFLEILEKCSFICSKSCSHYDEPASPSSIPAEELHRKFAVTYEAVLDFLTTAILKLDFRKIRLSHDKMYSMLLKKPHKIYFRDNEMKSLKKGLEEFRSICIHGDGGVGKTSLALLYADQSLSEYQCIFFIRSNSDLSLNQDFTRMAQKLDLPGANDDEHSANRELALSWLSNTSEVLDTRVLQCLDANELLALKWLLIFDEADNGDLTDDFWPMGENGAIIVTTRAQSVGCEYREEQIHLDSFSSEVGAEVVRKLLTWGRGPPVDLVSAKLLNDELGGLPLGIKHTVALIRTERTPLPKFVTLYRENKHRYHSRPPGRGGSDLEKRLHTNWLVSFQSLQKLPHCRVLFGILTLLEHTSIPQELFNHWSSPVSRSTGHLLGFCQRETEARKLLIEFNGKGTTDQDQTQSITLVEHNLQRIRIQSKSMTVERTDLEDMIHNFEKRDNWFMTGHCYMVLGMFLQESEDISQSEDAFLKVRSWLDKPGRAEKSPSIAMMIYKLGYVAYVKKDFIKAE
ncbi:hypothetical protein LCI18_009904 [Fusarium solani-melongenae]|uniref:Uncharacterized protein n=1 Tax=Fusarium solani subsp. cucurbitae TaxID=2747967 RepID=A0ACD3ZCH3_FUSSC|nr:hypothetical protein LCI18_009904 [Fusarium solani-melongenae]